MAVSSTAGIRVPCVTVLAGLVICCAVATSVDPSPTRAANWSLSLPPTESGDFAAGVAGPAEAGTVAVWTAGAVLLSYTMTGADAGTGVGATEGTEGINSGRGAA